jgi:hypothetical protein
MATDLSALGRQLSTRGQASLPTNVDQPIIRQTALIGPTGSPQTLQSTDTVFDPTGANWGGLLPSGSPSILRMPTDSPMAYTQIFLLNYKRQNWNEVGIDTLAGSIVLPLPMSYPEIVHVDYETIDLGVVGAFALGATVDPSILQQNWQVGAQAVASAVQGLGSAFATDIAQNALQSAKVGQAAQARFGVRVNNFMTVMLRGPTYKKFSFTWLFSPKNPQEAETLAIILQVLRDAMSPTLIGMSAAQHFLTAPLNVLGVNINQLSPNAVNVIGSAFFGYPKLFLPRFYYQDPANLGKYLFVTRPCVLENVLIDRGVGGPAFHAVRQLNNVTVGPTPSITRVTMDFEEVELWLQGDYARYNSSANFARPIPQANPGIVGSAP